MLLFYYKPVFGPPLVYKFNIYFLRPTFIYLTRDFNTGRSAHAQAIQTASSHVACPCAPVSLSVAINYERWQLYIITRINFLLKHNYRSNLGDFSLFVKFTSVFTLAVFT